MRVLDLGCGRGASSVFLHREFGVQVWAADLWFDVAERRRRIEDAGVGDAVFPVHAEAHALPFAPEFFDAVVSIDSFPYYGTDDLYLGYLTRFVRPGGWIGIAGSGLTSEIDGPVPEHLRDWWEPALCCLHTCRLVATALGAQRARRRARRRHDAGRARGVARLAAGGEPGQRGRDRGGDRGRRQVPRLRPRRRAAARGRHTGRADHVAAGRLHPAPLLR